MNAPRTLTDVERAYIKARRRQEAHRANARSSMKGAIRERDIAAQLAAHVPDEIKEADIWLIEVDQ